MIKALESQILIRINTIENTKSLVDKASKFKSEIDAKQGRYIVDAKSIIGIYSLDITKPVWLEIKSHDRDEIVDFYFEMEEFEIESSDPESRNSTIAQWFRDLKTY